MKDGKWKMEEKMEDTLRHEIYDMIRMNTLLPYQVTIALGQLPFLHSPNPHHTIHTAILFNSSR